MISVQEALHKIREHCTVRPPVLLPLHESGGFVLAENIAAPTDSPHFNQSAMDGYAFSYDDWDGNSDLTVSGEVQAGNNYSEPLNPHSAVRIFTGAALPSGTDTVVIQENVLKKNGSICIKDSKIIKGSNVRLTGSQTRKGEIVFLEGHLLTPASVAYLAEFGIQKVSVYSKPIISIINTGKELLHQGEKREAGKIYESNSFGLRAALEQMHISPDSVEMADDDERAIEKAIRNRLRSDILILTGGVSVGDYDFVTSALEKCGVKLVFHKIRQKPGKPLYFGVHRQTLVFGLPGNPASALTCFYEYVSEAISCLTKKTYFKRIHLPLAESFSKKPGVAVFLKGKINGNTVSVLANQESYKLNSFASADCLIELDEAMDRINTGDLVRVLQI